MSDTSQKNTQRDPQVSIKPDWYLWEYKNIMQLHIMSYDITTNYEEIV